MGLTRITSDGITDGAITGADLATNIDLADNKQLRLGTGNDLQIYHNGSHSVIQNDTGTLFTLADNLSFKNNANNETLITAAANGAVELYHNNSKKFETTSGGVQVTDNLNMSGGHIFLADSYKLNVGTSDDLQIYHDGSNSYIAETGTGVLRISGSAGVYINKHDQTETMAAFLHDAGVELYHNNVKIFETISTGIQVTGNVTPTGYMKLVDNMQIYFGTGNDLEIYHDGSNSYIKDAGTGSLLIRGSTVSIQSVSGEAMIEGVADGAVTIKHDNSKKFETTSSGVKIIGDASTGNIVEGDLRFKQAGSGTTRIQWRGDEGDLKFNDTYKATFGSGNDLTIDHDGSHSNIHNTGTGNLHIRGNGTDQIKIQAKSGEQSIVCSPDGDVELYHNNSKKLDTESDGVKISGVCTATHGFLIDDTATTQDQARGIRWTGFDKEGTTDPSDNAGIIWTVNDSGLSGSVLKIFVENDDNDGVVIKGGNTTGSYGTKIVNGLEIKSGGLRPTTGTSQNGIRWGDDFAGGSGDRCSIQYYQDGSGEDTRLRLFIENDSQDDIRLEAPSTVHIQGSLSKSSGSFRIPHVLPDLTKTTDLVHSFVESPQADNIYRGRAKLVNGTAAINIDTTNNMTEGTFVNLNRDVQCFTTNETGWAAIKGSVTDNILTITAQDNNCTDTISWMVIGERWDLAMYDPKNPMTDANGKVKTEIPNNSINKGGDYEQDYIKENKYRVGISTIARPSIENKEVE